ncbi:MAG: hypothetical protein IK075_11730 [Prevotella sp.]|nr:hypothetical protein [Prevotella sp.]
MRTIKLWMLAAILICGANVFTACTNDTSDNPATPSQQELEQSIVGLWWDEFEYADVTEAGVPFSRVMLAVKADADHTGCIYLGVFGGEKGSAPLAVYGGPQDAGFTWRLLADGSVLLGDPVTGETYTVNRTRGDNDDSYGDGMTDVTSTSVTYTDNSMKVTNDNYSGELVKANAEKEAEIEETLSTLSPDRQEFEAQLSKMLAESQNYIKLEPTMRAANLLTEFIDQLKISALKPQFTQIVLDAIGKGMAASHNFTDQGFEEAKWALENSNVSEANADGFFLMNVAVALSHCNISFTTGKDVADYEKIEDDVLVISAKNATSGALTKVRMKFSGANDGVIIFLAKLGDYPVAVQFPHMIDMELLRSETGNDADEESVMKGQLMLETTDGKKFLSLKHGEWKGTLFTEAKKADRYEIPACTLFHHADHTVEATASIGINDKKLLDIKVQNETNPYTDEELEQLRELRDIAPLWKGAYTLLKAFNSRTGTAEMTITEDLLFDIKVLDIGNCFKAVGYAMKNRREQPEVIDPWTDMLNQSVTFTVTQKSTGVKAEGKFITSNIAGVNLPSLALRFKGESDFHLIHDRMNPTDRQYYEALLKGLGEPINTLNALLKVIQDKGVELKETN